MKNIFLTLALLLTVSFAFANVDGVNTSKLNTNKIETLNVLQNPKTNSEPAENLEVCVDGISCYMTVSGTTSSGIKYHISGHCAAVLRDLRKLEQL